MNHTKKLVIIPYEKYIRLTSGDDLQENSTTTEITSRKTLSMDDVEKDNADVKQLSTEQVGAGGELVKEKENEEEFDVKTVSETGEQYTKDKTNRQVGTSSNESDNMDINNTKDVTMIEDKRFQIPPPGLPRRSKRKKTMVVSKRKWMSY